MAKKVNYLSNINVATLDVDRACADILANDRLQTPIVGEDVFINTIIPLLQRPWNERNLANYKKYVGELTMGLRVAGVRDGKTVELFTVPALHARVDTSQSSAEGITVGHLVEHAATLRLRGTNEPVERYVTDYLHKISQIVPIEQKLIIPLGGILAYYGKTFLDDEGNPLYTLDGSDSKGNAKPSGPSDEDSFESDGYLDED